MKLPKDYRERVYAAVLGKIIGVYLGRPFEGWSHERIVRELGDITGYVNEKLGQPLVVTDDDITGTFTFLRALEDSGAGADISAPQISRAWLNYIVEGKAILWWGGMGESTEHTAYLRLRGGTEAPASGSRALNGRIVSEQIGAQIFIDGWALVAPGDPELAVKLAEQAARVSHDGEAVYAAQVIAAMEAAAFFERDIDRLVETAVRFIPADSTIRRVIDDVREWSRREKDWRRTRALIAENHGYARYGGHVPVVPNFAVVLMALLQGDSSLQKSLMIANTSGWDTDCNSGNVGCLLGIKEGLALFEGGQGPGGQGPGGQGPGGQGPGGQGPGGPASHGQGPDWRGPVSDRMYLPTADGGRSITDAASEACRIVSLGEMLSGARRSPAPKAGARFHFELPGSVQGFSVDPPRPGGGAARIENVEGHSAEGHRSLAVRFSPLVPRQALRVTTPTFIPPDSFTMKGYELLASPTLSSGQALSLRVEADAANAADVEVRAVVKIYGPRDEPKSLTSLPARVQPGRSAHIEWAVPDTDAQPIFAAGIEVSSDAETSGAVYLDFLSWSGVPRAVFRRPAGGGEAWRRVWVNATDHLGVSWPEAFRFSQDRGTGMLITGCREWTDYRVSAAVGSDMAADFGLAIRVQGLRRYYAVVVTRDGKAELRKVLHDTFVLSAAAFSWTVGSTVDLMIEAEGNRIRASVSGKPLFDVSDTEEPLEGGGTALVCTEGCLWTNEVRIEPIRGG